jgi:hypothetical protein
MDTGSSQELQQRFTQLAQHSFRVKISVLLLLLVSLYVVWSTLTNGSAKAEEVDKAFCSQIIKDPYYGRVDLRGDYSCDPQTSLHYTISQARHQHDDDPPYPSTMSPQDVLKNIGIWLKHVQQFNDYEWNRRQAYRVELSLPYTKSASSLNGSLISDVWPFCALFALSIAVTLGFRQTCYEIHLSALVADTTPANVRGRSFALSDSLAGEISEAKLGGHPIFLYKKPIGLLPETAVSAVLFGAVLLLSLNLLTDYSPQFTERGYELFGDSYYTWLYLFSVALFFLLFRTRRQYRRSVNEAVGGEVKSARLFFLYRCFQSLRQRSFRGIGLEPALVLACAGCGIGSLFLSWGGSYRGFILLCCPLRIYDDQPLAARMIQAQMVLAVIFLISIFVSRLPMLVRRHRVHALLLKARFLTAWPILIFGGFVVFYAVIGIYGALKDLYVAPALGLYSSQAMQNLQNLPTLDEADFSLGFMAFVASCGILALHEIYSRTKGVRLEARESLES